MTEDRSLEAKLDAYAELLVKKAVNLQEGQELVVAAPIQAAPFARTVIEKAYLSGARHVTVIWGDDETSHLIYKYTPLDFFESYPAWAAERLNSLALDGAAFLFLSGEDPNALFGIDPRKPAANVKASHAACGDYRKALDFGRNVWVIAGVSTPAWAQMVFPDLSEEHAVDALWNAILKTARADGEDPIAAWDAHKESFDWRKRFLNEARFDKLRYTNSIGTDITIGLTDKHLWEGGGSQTIGGTYFFPNVPTEEIFTTPHRDRVNGIAYSAMPLVYQGNVIEDFWFKFEDGAVVEFDAGKGKEILAQLLEIDEGARHLGEVALIPITSPIYETGIFFYSTLYDENASCHLAVGLGFPDAYENGVNMTEDELLAVGVNKSATHVDFMIGTNDLSIVGTTKDGIEIQIFENGLWAF
ncbi:MAG: aminopeptidase [Actinobacteria bacterium]|nr:aminopeptidase [Actinomycetota bacterium]